MATRYLTRALVSTTKPLTAVLSHPYTTAAGDLSAVIPKSSFIFRLRRLAAAASAPCFGRLAPAMSARGFATRQTSSSLNDANPNWSNRPPKETILLEGCDFEHWLVVMEPPEPDLTRDDIIDSYIKTLATVIGSEDEARMKIYSVSTRHYFAFGALVSEEVSYKIKELPKVRWVLPDSYLDVRNKDYGGEPFINGQAVPYDPKYHEEWVRNNSRANERNRRNDRPRNHDRSRNFERRRDMQMNSQNSGGDVGGPQNLSVSPPQNAPYGGMPPQNIPGNYPPRGQMNNQNSGSNIGGPQKLSVPPPQNAPNYGGMLPQNNPGNYPPRVQMNDQNSGGNIGGPQNLSVPPPQNVPNYGRGMLPQNNPGNYPPRGPPLANPPRMQMNDQNSGGNIGGPQNLSVPPPQNAPNYGGGMLPQNNPGNHPPRGPPLSNNAPNYQYGPNSGPAPYQPGLGPNQGGFAPGMGPGQVQNPNNAYAPNVGGGNPYQGQNVPPQPPSVGFSPRQNSGGFSPNVGYGPGQNQNSYGQNQNGYAPNVGGHTGQGQSQGGYGNPPQDVHGRDPNY